MKSYNKCLYILLVILIFTSCHKKYDFTANDDVVGASKVIYFPIVKLKGDQTMVLTAGSAFTDPGVDATVQGKTVTPVVTGTVNASTPGIYYLSYTCKNDLGFSASAYRIVIVKSASPVAPDYSGQWKRNAGVFGVQTWHQLTPTTYAVLDPGGANYANFWCVVTIVSGAPVINAQQTYQTLGGSLVNINSLSSSAFTGTTVGSSFTWAINTTGFGTGNRTFVKQ